jgi:hypothetical protein
MHTIIVLAIGFGLLLLCVLLGRLIGGLSGISTGALIFLPLWLVGAGINMYIGVVRAGYSISEEVPMFALVFGIPAIAAVIVWWALR